MTTDDETPPRNIVTDGDIQWTLGPVPADPPPADIDDLITALMLDIRAYRVLTVEALHALHKAESDYKQLRRIHQRTVEEYRELRVRMMRDAGVKR